jgi:hypothetical protein
VDEALLGLQVEETNLKQLIQFFRINIKMYRESWPLVTSLPKIISASTFVSASVMASSAKETHCLKSNLDQYMKQERLINHQITFPKDNFKTLALISQHTSMHAINPLLCINHHN